MDVETGFIRTAVAVGLPVTPADDLDDAMSALGLDAQVREMMARREPQPWGNNTERPHSALGDRSPVEYWS